MFSVGRIKESNNKNTILRIGIEEEKNEEIIRTFEGSM